MFLLLLFNILLEGRDHYAGIFQALAALAVSNSSFVSPFLVAKSLKGAIVGFTDVVVSGRRSESAAFFHGCNKDAVGVGR